MKYTKDQIQQDIIKQNGLVFPLQRILLRLDHLQDILISEHFNDTSQLTPEQIKHTEDILNGLIASYKAI